MPLIKTKSNKAVAIQPGHLGNLSEIQEAKLRALWAIGLKFIEIYEADESNKHHRTMEEKYVPPAKKRNGVRGATRQKYPVLVKELLSLLPTDERDMDKLAQQAVEALDHWTPDMYRLIVLKVVKHEHPDALALRFLRASNWDIIKATKMMGNAIYWRTMDAGVDDVIMKHGEGGAAEDEENGQGFARNIGGDFMKQLRMGKAFIHGTDREGRPVIHIRVKLHKKADQCPQSIERFSVYMLELARLALRAPVESGTIILDLTGFRLSNFDLGPIKYILKTIQDNYPDALGLILIHNAPFGGRTLWRLLKIWFDKRITSKIHFTYNAFGLKKYIEPEKVIVGYGYGGKESWAYEYQEPMAYENRSMTFHETRDAIMAEREELATQFENLTREWVMAAQSSEKGAELRERRNQLVQDLAVNYWELDPFVRARSLYDRMGNFAGAGGVEWYNVKADDESLLKKVKTMTDSVTASHHEDATILDDESSYDSE